MHVAAITHCSLSQDMLWAITYYFDPITVELGYHASVERLLDRAREPLVDPAHER